MGVQPRPPRCRCADRVAGALFDGGSQGPHAGEELLDFGLKTAGLL